MWHNRQIFAVLLILATTAGLLRAQTGEPEEPPRDAPPSLSDPSGSEISPFTLGKRGRLIAEDAESAEELENAKRSPRVWGRAEILLWFIRPANLPPLVTTGPYTETSPGNLASPETVLLFGQRGMDFQDRAGGRFTFGGWLDDDQNWGVDAGYFFLKGRAIRQSFTSPGNPVLATPFTNTLSGAADSNLITFPGIASGSISVDAPSFLQGAEINLTAALLRDDHFRWSASAGFRWLNLNEGLRINSVSVVELAPAFVGLGIPYDGNTIFVNDSFETRNHFFGGQVGGRVELSHKRWTLDLEGKVALGVTHEIVAINGSTTIDTAPATAINAGFMALSSNSGRFTQNHFTVVPEARIKMGFRLTERIQIFAGYSFLYWSRVARPADQVDTSVNPNLVPTSMTYGAPGGPSRPALVFRSTDFFAHGVNVGLEVRY